MKQTASIVMSDDPSLLFRIRPFQKQRGGTDCGVFAIAAATSICNGHDPSTLHYDQHAMRVICTIVSSRDILTLFHPGR